jgi:hypothetical protein
MVDSSTNTKQDIDVKLLIDFAEYILHNANWSESYSDKPWYSESFDKTVDSTELVELFLKVKPI